MTKEEYELFITKSKVPKEWIKKLRNYYERKLEKGLEEQFRNPN